MLSSMSIPSKIYDDGNTIHTMAKQDYFSNKFMYTWQLPKLKVAPSISSSMTTPSTPSRTSFSTAPSPPMAGQRSFHTSPDGPTALQFMDPEKIPPLSLPTSPPLESLPTATTSIDTYVPSRPPGLIRRLSRGASNRIRGRSSVSNMKSRDQNVGSVVRRRSNSRAVIDGSYDIQDSELDDAFEAEDAVVAPSPLAGDTPWPSQRPNLRSVSRRPSEKDTTDSIWAPPKPSHFTKITRKKKKFVRLELDVASGKISWAHQTSTARKHLYLDDIREIRAGDRARNYLAEFLVPEELLGHWFTIVYFDPERTKGRAIKFMHLIAPDAHVCDQWVRAVQHAMRTRDNLMSGMVINDEKQWLTLWHREMIKRFGTKQHVEEDERLDFFSIKNICRNLSINKSERLLKAQFEDVTGGRLDASLNQKQYLEFFRRLTERRDIRRMFDTAIGTFASSDNLHPTGNMSISDFTHFLQSTQMVDTSINPAGWLATFQKFAGKRRGQCVDPRTAEDPFESGITFEAFKDYLWSSANSPLKPLLSEPILNRPLNEYYISSSHNTYLEGRQVRGESSAEMYIEALKKGCRCIEIDCENGVDGKPCVTHVKTGTTRISFLDCIKTINQYAFYASDYPLIVSLEVHCNAEQQKLMAEIMVEQFGSRLVRQPLGPGNYGLPSPEELKHRVLIKVKKPNEEVDLLPLTPSLSFGPSSGTPPVGHRRQRSLSAPNPLAIQQNLPKAVQRAPQPPLGPRLQSITLVMAPSGSMTPVPRSATGSLAPTSSDDSELDQALGLGPKKSKPKSNIVKELGVLGVYTRGVKFSDWKSTDSRSPNHVYSFNETTFENKCKTPEGKILLERHNTKCLMRVYPRPTRIYSSNFDPLQFWRRGAQMVATNWQTYDLGTQINDAMFAAGLDRTGYVLKQEELRRFQGSDTGSSLRKRKIEKRPVTFSVDIISAQYLDVPDVEMNPYVEFEVYCAEDKAKEVAVGGGGREMSARSSRSGQSYLTCRRTRIVDGNGFNPVFWEQEKDTITITVNTKFPGLVFVRWTVWNSPDGHNSSASKDPIAMFTAKLSSLEQGYRHLPLYNKRGELLHSKLFCRIRKGHHRSLELDQHESPLIESFRPSEEATRSGKDFLKRVFSRTPSERRRAARENESGYFSRTQSRERRGS